MKFILKNKANHKLASNIVGGSGTFFSPTESSLKMTPFPVESPMIRKQTDHETEEITHELNRREALKTRSSLTSEEIDLIAYKRIFTANWSNYGEWKTYGCSDCSNASGRANRRKNSRTEELQTGDIPVKVKLKSREQILAEIKEEFKSKDKIDKKMAPDNPVTEEPPVEKEVKKKTPASVRKPPKKKRKPEKKEPKEVPKQSPTVEKEEPKPMQKDLTLNIPFVNNRVRFAGNPSRVLNAILYILRKDPRNKIRLSPNTAYSKGVDIIDGWGIFGDADTSDELVQRRGNTIRNWFLNRGVPPSQIIIDTSNSFNKKVNVTGTLTVYQ
ncbi:MAG: hypothetical protein AAFP76_10350 [Bacteroidota bacterium]